MKLKTCQDLWTKYRTIFWLLDDSYTHAEVTLAFRFCVALKRPNESLEFVLADQRLLDYGLPTLERIERKE